MRHTILLSLPLACTLHAGIVRAQAAPDTTCSYTRCALRVDHGFLSTKLVRGATAEPVARLGPLGTGVSVLLKGSDSAAYHARRYQTKRKAIEALGIGAAALALTAVWTTDESFRGEHLLVGSVVLQAIGLPFWVSARRSLDRAVWWYNRDLPRP